MTSMQDEGDEPWRFVRGRTEFSEGLAPTCRSAPTGSQHNSLPDIDALPTPVRTFGSQTNCGTTQKASLFVGILRSSHWFPQVPQSFFPVHDPFQAHCTTALSEEPERWRALASAALSTPCSLSTEVATEPVSQAQHACRAHAYVVPAPVGHRSSLVHYIPARDLRPSEGVSCAPPLPQLRDEHDSVISEPPLQPTPTDRDPVQAHNME